MTPPLEIERRFLIPDVAQAVGQTRGKVIRQGYLAVEAGRNARVRRADDDYFLTVKNGKGLVRQEVELDLTREQFDQLWPLTEGRRVEKMRHEIPHGDLTIEVDVFEGTLAPLCIAEVEFPSVEASERFVPPTWFGAEITSRVDYSNSSLALHGLPADG